MFTSPMSGLAAWIVEKLQAWSDCDGDIRPTGRSTYRMSQLRAVFAFFEGNRAKGSTSRRCAGAGHRAEYGTPAAVMSET